MSAARLPSARALAARVLERVERDRAYAAAALDAELARYPQLEARERGLATELVYGCLRTRTVLLERLARFAPRGLARKDAGLVAHLLIAAYQLLLLERVPGYAAVDEAVGAIRALRGARVAAFANAVLRKLGSDSERLDPGEAIVASAPGWLKRELEEVVGADEMRALLGVAGLAPATLRVNPNVSWPDWLRQAEPGGLSPLCRILAGGGDPRQREGFAEGAFVVQEQGAQLIGLALGVQPGERVLDACAGRGQKASLLASQLGASGELWATDLHPAKLQALLGEFERLRLPAPQIAAVDFSVGSGELEGSFDRVLVDAPCTGVGTLRRRPEIAARLEPDDPARLGELAARILRGAGERARPGGRVVYAVCSVLREECEAVIERVQDLLVPAGFEIAEIERLAAPGASSLRLLPGRHGTDGYFLASLLRRSG